MLNTFIEFAAAMPEGLHHALLQHLLRDDHQEDLCFAIWYPSRGERRLTALIHDLILPQDGERDVHGNVSFAPEYFARAIAIATERGAGLAFLHSHGGPGWQSMSLDDVNAEAGHAGAALGATALPLLGLTVGTDGAWSARFWRRCQPRKYERVWCETVRVPGQQLRLTYHPQLRPETQPGAELERTVGVWGLHGQAQMSRLRVGIIGLGSVGSIVCEALARMGLEYLTLIDYDIIELRNLDRIQGATHRDIGRRKVDVAADNAVRSATSPRLRVDRIVGSVVEADGYRAALDCDLLFCCVDRPWARRVLNHIAYAHLIPVINGGIHVRVRGERLVGADWHVHTVAPGRRCLECLKAYDPSLVSTERAGLLDDPSYLSQLDPNSILLRHENVYPFSLNVASLEVMHMTALVVGPLNNLGDQNYHYVSGTLDRRADDGCDDNCLYPPLVATGDTQHNVTGHDCGAEKRRNHAE